MSCSKVWGAKLSIYNCEPFNLHYYVFTLLDASYKNVVMIITVYLYIIISI